MKSLIDSPPNTRAVIPAFSKNALVVVTPVPTALPNDRLVVVALIPERLTNEKLEKLPFVLVTLPPVIVVNASASINPLVEVTFVNTAVEGVTDPIGVLLIIPPSIVSASETEASIILSSGNVSNPVTTKFVEVVCTKKA